MSLHKIPPILICGVVRNAAAALPATLKVIDSLRASSERAHCIIVTNDNSDNTLQLIRAWKQSSAPCDILEFDGLIQSIPERVDRIAFARNCYLSMIREEKFNIFQLVCVLDLDGPNSELRSADVLQSIQVPCAWDAIFSNQRQCYYDIYALRHAKWCPNDSWREVKGATGFLFRRTRRRRAIKKFIRDRQYFIPPSHPPIEVDSAFGGLAIYRKNALEGCWYGSRDRHDRIVCEHVILHQQMRNKGERLYIVPSLLNDAPPEHLGPASGQPFPSEYADVKKYEGCSYMNNSKLSAKSP